MPPVGRLSHLVIDCADLDVVTDFWTALLDVGVQLRWKQYVVLTGGPGQTALAFQQVAEPKVAKLRAHVDIEVDDLDVAEARVLELGGTTLDEHLESGVRIRVMADPEGNELCLVKLPS